MGARALILQLPSKIQSPPAAGAMRTLGTVSCEPWGGGTSGPSPSCRGADSSLLGSSVPGFYSQLLSEVALLLRPDKVEKHTARAQCAQGKDLRCTSVCLRDCVCVSVWIHTYVPFFTVTSRNNKTSVQRTWVVPVGLHDMLYYVFSFLIVVKYI